MLGFITKIKNYDKYLHLFVGLFVTFVVSLYSMPLGALATLALAYGKEVYDGKHPESHSKDGWDAFSTAAGIAAGQGLAVLALQYREAILGLISW